MSKRKNRTVRTELSDLEMRLSAEIRVAEDMRSTDRAKAAAQLRHVQFCLEKAWEQNTGFAVNPYLAQALGAVRVLVDLVEAK